METEVENFDEKSQKSHETWVLLSPGRAFLISPVAIVALKGSDHVKTSLYGFHDCQVRKVM